MAEPERRRRRVRPSSTSAAAPVVPPSDNPPPEPPAGSATTAPITDPDDADTRPAEPRPSPPAAAERSRPAFPRRPGNGSGSPSNGNGSGPQSNGNGSAPAADDRENERGLRGLVGSGSSQVSVGAAMRARDAARPTDANLDDADRNLVIVRRNWVPREELPRNR